MIKHTFLLLMAMMLLTTTAYAAEPDIPEGITITDVTELQSEAGYPMPEFFPTDIQTKTENGVKLLLKTYEVAADVSHAVLIENGLAQNGTEYELRDILRKTAPDEQEKKTVSQSATVSAESDKTANILKLLPKSVEYSENGFTGQLVLDENSISTEVESTESYRYAITDTREYPGLIRNDPYLLPKSVQKNGVSLVLCDVNWSPGYDYNPNPANYSATATYKGFASGSKPSEYVATAVYSGEVSKNVPANVEYTLIYAEKPIAPIELPAGIDWQPILFILGGIVLAAGIGAGILFFIHRRQSMTPAFAEGEPDIPRKEMYKPSMLTDLEDEDYE